MCTFTITTTIVVIVITTAATTTTTLVGLLDYEELDDAEHQVELAVLAESVHEALMKGYGDAIYNALLANR